MPLKQQKSLFAPVICKKNSKCALTRRAAVQNMCSICSLLFYATLMPLWLCTTLNCALHYSNYVRNTFKAGQEEWPLLSGHRWYVDNFESVFPSREVVRVDWFSVGWLMLVG